MQLNDILHDDFSTLYSELKEDLSILRGKSLLITGANGMLAGYLLKFLSYLNHEHGFNLKAEGLVREIKPHGLSGVEFIHGDVCTYNFQDKKYHYIIHAASLASPIHYGSNPIGVSLPNVLGTIQLLNLAEKSGVESFLFVSSSEVYGDFGTDKIEIDEKEFGSLDPINPRSCYAESKRMGESLCISWFNQKKVPTKIVRPFHTYGPGLTRHDGRVYADFIYSIIDRKDIVLNSKGEAKRAFCYQSDALKGMLLVLLKGQPGEAYNLGNPDQELSIFEAAQAATVAFPERKLKVTINEANLPQGYLKSRVLRNCPSISKMKNLGWQPKISFLEGVRRTVKHIEEGV